MERNGECTGTGPCVVVLAITLLLFPSLFLPVNTGAESSTEPASSPLPPTVIAYWDRGINPYHVEFRAPEWTDHPSTYLPDYPESAVPLELTLDAESFEEAWQADQEAWSSLERGQVYYVPGTRIVAAMFNDLSRDTWYDGGGHGTGVASAGSGSTTGTAPDSAIVVATLLSCAKTWNWFNAQPWIDFVAWQHVELTGVTPPVLCESHVAGTRDWAESGRTSFGAGGNRGGYNQLDRTTGPPWVMTVGGFRIRDWPDGSQTTAICSRCERPFDVAARYDVTTAADSFDSYVANSGTSFAAPSLAGYAARLVELARERIGPGDPESGLYARATEDVTLPSDGPLADGDFTARELEELILKTTERLDVETAIPNSVVPTLPLACRLPEAEYPCQGYGAFDEEAFERAVDVLAGEAPLPERPVDDEWHARFDAIAYRYWGTRMCHYDNPPIFVPGCIRDVMMSEEYPFPS